MIHLSCILHSELLDTVDSEDDIKSIGALLKDNGVLLIDKFWP